MKVQLKIVVVGLNLSVASGNLGQIIITGDEILECTTRSKVIFIQ